MDIKSKDDDIAVAFVSWHLLREEEPSDGVAVYNANIMAKLREMGVRVYKVWREKGVNGLWPIYNVRTLNYVLKIIRNKEKNLIVHGSNADGFFFALLKDIPYVHTLHTVLLDELTAAGELHNALSKIRIDRLFTYEMLILAERIAATNADYVIVPSYYLKDVAVKYIGLPSNKVIVIPHGVNIEEFKRAEEDTHEKSDMQVKSSQHVIRILSVGKLVKRKGFIYQIKACEALARRYRIELRIVGDGPERAFLERYCKSRGLNFVKFLGKLPRSRTVREFVEADIFCLSSLHESFGIVLLEAMAAKKPIVATRVGGVPEVIIDGETGLLVPPKDVEALANALEKLIVDEELRIRLGINGYKRALSYTWDKTTKKLLQVYRSLL